MFGGKLEEISEVNSLIVAGDFVFGDKTGVDEAGDAEAIILTSLAPEITFYNSVRNELLAMLIANWGETDAFEGRGEGLVGSLGDAVRGGRSFCTESGDGFNEVLGFATEVLELAIVFVASTVELLFVGVHGGNIFIKLAGGGLRLDV